MSRIDTHHHVYPPVYTQALQDAGGDPSGWYVPAWTVEADQKLAQRVGVKTAILSATAPGPEIAGSPEAAAKLARAINEFNANLKKEFPGKYGYFASVPSLLDTKLALEEIAYALDHLDADGIVLMTRYGSDNHYLGHPDFAPIWDELNRRRAVVFVHPTHPVDEHLVDKYLPQPMFDYPHETGRTAADLILTDTLRKHARDTKIILSHAGGSFPMLVHRIAGLLPHSQFAGDKDTDEIIREAGWFYYDTALSSSKGQLAALLAIAPHDHILFGTDFPNAPEGSITYFTDLLGEVDADLLDAINHESAKKLFPRLA